MTRRGAATRKPIVFLGPSLPWDAAREILDADYRPPVQRGDVYRAAKEAPPLLGIVDGVFLATLPPSPLEVARALRAGVPIMGAASLGALRAVELRTHGMIGVGTIYRWYLTRRVIADDEVALVFSPDDFRPLSEPLVNIRYALSAARRAGIITADERSALVRIGKQLYYPDRGWPRLFKEATGVVAGDTLARMGRFVMEGTFDLKREDAVRLLVRARRFLERR